VIDGSSNFNPSHCTWQGGLVLSNKIHSTLLQGMVDTDCVFWDYEFEKEKESCMIESISNLQK
jgi:hypothetical protein